jgi:hypothetical protein
VSKSKKEKKKEAKAKRLAQKRLDKVGVRMHLPVCCGTCSC